MSNRPQKARIWHSFDRLYNCHSTPDSNHYRKPRTPIRPFCSCTTTNYAVSFCFFVLVRELPSSERWTQEALVVVVVLVVVQHYISTQTVKNSEGKTENKKPIPPSTTMMGSIKSHASAMRIEILRPPFQRPDTHTHTQTRERRERCHWDTLSSVDCPRECHM